MTEKKMTKKELYNVIKEAMADNADVVAFCEKEIAALDNKAIKAKERAAKKAAEGDALMDAVLAVLSDEPMTGAEILDAVNDENATVSKVIYRANALVKDGKAAKCEVVVTDENGAKPRKLVAFTVVE